MGKELINNIEESFNRVEKAYSVFLKTVGQGKIRGGKYKFRKLINGRIRYFYTEEEMNREIEKSYFGKFMGFFQFKSKKEGESKIKKDFSEAEKSITGLTIDIFRKFSLEYFANKEKIDLALNKAKKEKLKEENGSNADPKEPNSNKPKAEPTDHNDPGNKEPKPKTVNLKTKVFQFLNKKYGQPIPEESKPVEAHSPDVQSENVGSDKVENNFDTMPEVKANTPRQETVLDPPTGEVKNTIPENPKVIKAIENLKEASQPAIPEPESIGMRIEYKSFNTVKKGVVTGQKVVNGKVFYAVNFDDGTNSSLIAKEKTTIEGEDNFDTMPEVESPKTSEETPIQAPEPMEAIGEVGNQSEYKQKGTRAKAFKQWFGDWEIAKQTGDYSNVSKVIDSVTGEPKETYEVNASKVTDKEGNPIQVYHGTAVGGFDEFKKENISSWNLYGKGFYFTEDMNIAKEYTEKDADPSMRFPSGTGIKDKEGNIITHIPFNKIDSKGDNTVLDNPNWNKQLKSALEKSKDDNGYNIQIFMNEYKRENSETWSKSHRKGLELFFSQDLTRIFGKDIQPIVDDSKVYSTYLNIKNPLDMNRVPPRHEMEKFLSDLNKHVKGVYMDDIFSSDELRKEVGIDISEPLKNITYDHLLKMKSLLKNKKHEDDYEASNWYKGHKKGDYVFPVMQRGEGLSYEQVYYMLTNDHKDSGEFTEGIRKIGYDGISHTGGWRNGLPEHIVWIAFQPNQIKAVDNSGDFDPTSNNIYKSILVNLRKKSSTKIIKSTINKLIILDNLKKLLRGKQNGEESTI